MERMVVEKSTSFSRTYISAGLLVVLVVIGLAALYSASYDKALKMGLGAQYFFNNQVTYGFIGVAAAVTAFLMPIKIYRFFTPLLILASIGLMVLTLFTDLGTTQMGARRWIQLGPIGFQPSELVKVSTILYLANYFDKKKQKMKKFSFTIYPAFVVCLFAGLILMQRDFSTMFLFVIVAVILFMAAGTRMSYLAYLLALVGIPGVVILLSESYRLKRVVGFLFKNIDPSDINYQVNASIQAIASGGIFGKGFGNGVYKLGRLPEVHSDFVFASFAEEGGWIGAAAVILLFCALAVVGYSGSVRIKQHNAYLYYIGIGATSLIAWQAFLNMGVVSGIIPPTGIPLPFFSQGGTSLVVSLGMGGMICKTLFAADKVDQEQTRNTPSNQIKNQEVMYE